MPDIIGLFKNALAGKKAAPMAADPVDAAPPGFDDDALLDLWKRIKKESLDSRWIWERQWQRNLWYILGRQWIEYFSDYGGWREKRLAPTVPRPVTNMCKDTVKVIRAIFTGIKLGVNVRPNGQSPENVAAATTADELSNVIHERHRMTSVLGEFDFWLVGLGNAFMHTFLDYDIKYGQTKISYEQCADCGKIVPNHERIQPTTTPCPDCQSTNFAPAIKDDGSPVEDYQPKGRPVTIALSPLEVAFPNTYTRFEDLPYIVRLRWRTKWYFEQHPQLKDLVAANKIKWSKSPNDRTLQLFKSLANHNDLGVMPTYLTEGSFGSDDDGVTEFEVQMKPCDAYPEGLVFRVLGDESPLVVHLEANEGLPGPLPYKDAEGNPLWTWTHAGYDPVGGRVIASSPIDLIIQKQDQLNQLDSMVMMTLMRLAAGGWIIPKGAEVENITKLSTPGVVVRWNPNTVGVNAKPERFEGAQINDSWFKYREQIIADIEKLSSTFDIIKGAKPTGVEAFSAMQLLVEQSQSAFSWPFSARGEAYKDWFKFALELEREYGPDEFIKSSLSPARVWSFKTFKRTQLQGSVSIVVEDGSTAPKTSLGMRAAIQQAMGMGVLDMTNADTKYEILKSFGLQRMVPSIDTHIQAALQKQQAFEEWIINPAEVQKAIGEIDQAIQQWAGQQTAAAGAPGPDGQPADGLEPVAPPPSIVQFTPLKWRPWYKATIHKQEFDKWANSDRIRELMKQIPGAEPLLVAHYQEMLQMIMQEQMMEAGAAAPPGIGGGAMAMANSNRETAKGAQPSGAGQGAQRQGPA